MKIVIFLLVWLYATVAHAQTCDQAIDGFQIGSYQTLIELVKEPSLSSNRYRAIQVFEKYLREKCDQFYQSTGWRCIEIVNQEIKDLIPKLSKYHRKLKNNPENRVTTEEFEQILK